MIIDTVHSLIINAERSFEDSKVCIKNTVEPRLSAPGRKARLSRGHVEDPALTETPFDGKNMVGPSKNAQIVSNCIV